MKYLLLFLAVLASTGCQKAPPPDKFFGLIYILEDGRPVKVDSAQVWLFTEKGLDAFVKAQEQQLDAEKERISKEIADMDANYKKWGVTSEMTVLDRDLKIPADQALNVVEFETNRPAMEKALGKVDDFGFSDLPTREATAATIDEDGAFSVPLKAGELSAIAAHAVRDVSGHNVDYYWFSWLTPELLKRGKITLGKENLVNGNSIRRLVVDGK